MLGPLLSIGGQKLGNLLAEPNQSELLVSKDLVETAKAPDMKAGSWSLPSVDEVLTRDGFGWHSSQVLIADMTSDSIGTAFLLAGNFRLQ